MRLKASQATEIRLGRQRAPQHEEGEHLVPYLRSANITDGTLDLMDVKSMNFTPTEQVIFGLRDGDVLVTEGSGSRAAVGASAVWRQDSDDVVCFQNTLLRMRPRDGVTDPRYVAWWARHAHASGQMAAVATGANILHLGSDGLKQLEMDVPPLDEQRRIADFLDTLVARIDDAIKVRRHQRELSLELFRSRLDHEIWSGLTGHPLRRIAGDITSGPRGWGDLVADKGTPFLRIANLPSLGPFMRSEELVHVDVPQGAEARRATVRTGDVLMSITASMGNVAIVDSSFDGAAFSQHVARIRPYSDVDTAWLAWSLQSSRVLAYLATRSYGGTKIGLGLADVREIPVPDAPQARRVETGQLLTERWEACKTHVATLDAASDLLGEYKQSLITAAVTGEFDVTAATGRGMPGADA